MVVLVAVLLAAAGAAITTGVAMACPAGALIVGGVLFGFWTLFVFTDGKP